MSREIRLKLAKLFLNVLTLAISEIRLSLLFDNGTVKTGSLNFNYVSMDAFGQNSDFAVQTIERLMFVEDG